MIIDASHQIRTKIFGNRAKKVLPCLKVQGLRKRDGLPCGSMKVEIKVHLTIDIDKGASFDAVVRAVAPAGQARQLIAQPLGNWGMCIRELAASASGETVPMAGLVHYSLESEQPRSL